MTQTATAPSSVESKPSDSGVLAAVRQRLVPIEHKLDPYSWLATGLVVLIAAVMRLVKLDSPKGIIFDETYYANDAKNLLIHGVEWDDKNNSPGYVVHPPLGKWLIALGETVWPVGSAHQEWGWRISAAVIGTLSVLLVVRIALRMFGSIILACAAGLLMAFDGMHFVLSRTALLDVFLMFFILAAFGALVLDRDQRRKRWADFIASGGDPSGRGRAARPAFAIPWWRLLAAVLTGCALGVKWSALYVLPAFFILILWWEVGARRTAGVRRPIMDAFLDEVGWFAAFLGIMLLVYLATWSGWLLSDTGYNRHWLRDTGQPEPAFTGALMNLWHYHQQAFDFHSQLSEKHLYQSQPWQWLLLGRPVAFYYSSNGPCGAAQCAAEVILLGTPLLWWSFLPALGTTLWFGIARRDWRAAAILAMVVTNLLPWFFFPNRTMFYFYALPAEPFLILAVVFALGAIMTSPPGQPVNENRTLVGTVFAGAFVLIVALNFAYFYPLYVGDSIPYADWAKRMWLGNRWI